MEIEENENGDEIIVTSDFLNEAKINVQEMTDLIEQLYASKAKPDSTIVSIPTDFWLDEGQQYYPSSDPFQNKENLLKGNTVTELSLENVVPSNRTLVIVYQPEKLDGEFKERSARLIGSLNMADTIKAVVITVNGDKVLSGLNLGTPYNTGQLDEDALKSVKERFVQVVEVRYGS